MDTKKQKAALALKKESTHSIREICAIVGIARNTYYKYTRAENQPVAEKRRATAPKEHRQHPNPDSAYPQALAPDFLVLS